MTGQELDAKVLFLVPPLVPLLGEATETRVGHDPYRARYPHIGLAYMASVLKKNLIPYHIIDMNLGHSFNYVLSYLRRASPDFLCVTVYSLGYMRVYELVDALRAHYPGKIVLGGPHISIVGRASLEMTRADFAVVGEGEQALLELLTESQPEGIRGLVWRQDSQIVSNERRAYIADLDTLPYPAFQDFELESYLCAVDRRLPIITSRGCPFRCTFCCTPLSMGRAFRPRSAENVIGELQNWCDQGWKIFDFNDDVFSFDKDRARKICELILERGLKIRFNLAVGLRVNSVDRNLLQLMKDAGCRFISYGCEAGNDRVLKDIKKGIHVEDVVKAVGLTRSVGINHKVNFIIGHPTERYEDALDSLRLAKSLRCNFVGFNNLIPYPGTEAYDQIRANPNARFVVAPDVYLNQLTHKKMMPVYQTPEFPISKIELALRKGFDLEAKTLARFRFGRFKGFVVYILTRNKRVARASRRIFNHVVSTNIGSKVYDSLVKPPW